jgi:hypothetical protein
MRKRKIVDAQYAYSRGMWRIFGPYSDYIWIKGSGDPGVTVFLFGDDLSDDYFLSLGHKAPRYATKKNSKA